MRAGLLRCAGALVVVAAWSQAASAAPPPEVSGVRFTNATTLSWDSTAGADKYNVYRGSATDLRRGIPPRCHLWNVATTSGATPAVPTAGTAFIYLVTAVSNTQGEGGPGASSSGATRALLGDCTAVMNHHLLDRATFGWNEYVRDRLTALGPQGFINEQLNPASISEATNSDLNTRMSTLTPAENQIELVNRQITQAVYARRQLEQVVTVFWTNHFSTDYNQVFDSYLNDGITADAQVREMDKFRSLAFTGTFRDLVEASGLGPAMIRYLDTDQNVAGRPNENYGRELMELHTLGVDGGYTQQDVRQMARVFTGWTTCRKLTNQQNDPLAPCQLINGKYVANFDYTKHDCGAKTLFAGKPQQVNIPATCDIGGNPTTSGVNDAYAAFDAVADHPATKKFISTKLLQKFVTETPTAAQIQAVVDVWNSSGGDNRQVLGKVLEFALLLNPDLVGNKIKDPFEHMATVYRATRADTNDTNVNNLYNYLQRMQMLPHQKSEPTGFSELAKDWVNTNDLLERQNFAWDVTTDIAYRENIIDILAAAGLTAASPPGDLVDFYSSILFGKALTPTERQRAITFLTTDENGLPVAVDNTRIKKVVAFMMGYPQFLEQ